jgi:hypothetical protein
LSLDQKKLPDLANRKQDLSAKQKSYYEMAYQSLLACFNTSAEELRQAICADFQARQELANRLGFDLEPRLAILVCGDFDGDCVDEIALFPQTEGAPGKPFKVLKYEAKTKSWSRLVRVPDLPYGSDFEGGRLLETAKFAVAGHFTSREYDDLAIAGDYGPGVGFRVIGCEFSPEQAPVGWKRRNQKDEGFEFYCSGYVDARFATAGDFDGDGLDELAIAADLNGCNAFWVMNYDQDQKIWDSLGIIPGHEFNAGFVCNQQGLVGTALFAAAGDFDGDGIEELAVAIDDPGAPGGSFWVMKWDAGSKNWTHLGRTGFPHGKTGSLPLNADFSCGGSGPAYQAAAGNFSGGSSPARDLAVVLDGPNPGEYRIHTMKYDTTRKEWKDYAIYTFESHSADFLLLAGDFNNDRITELAIIQTNSSEKDNPVRVLKLKKVMDTTYHTEHWLWDVLQEVARPELLGTGNIQGNTKINLAAVGKFSAKPSVPGFPGQAKDELALVPELHWNGQNLAWVLSNAETGSGLKHLSPIPDHPLAADLACCGCPDQLDELFLQPQAEQAQQENMEMLLESLFGLQATYRDGLSTGVIFENKLFGSLYPDRWQFRGVSWNINTDPEGLIHVSFRSRRGGASSIEVFRDAARTELIASGAWNGATDTVELAEKNHSGLSGTFQVVLDNPLSVNVLEEKLSFSVIPKLACRRLKRLRRIWYEEDRQGSSSWPKDMPVVDPDLIGPEDFRYPCCTAAAKQPRAFDIWFKRRQWADQLLAQFAACTTQTLDAKGEHLVLPDIELMFRQMAIPVTYNSHLGSVSVQVWDTSKTDTWEGLLRQIDRSPRERSKACSLIAINLHLNIESFRRLMLLRAKALNNRLDMSQPSLTDSEWAEVYSILTQACKLRCAQVWLEEEAALGIKLSPEEFWKAFKEPLTGSWAPPQVKGDCLLDPDRISREELPASDLDLPVVALWQERRQWLDEKHNYLRAKRESGGKDGVYLVLEEIYGTGKCRSLEKLYKTVTSDIKDDDPDKLQAIEEIEQNLMLTVAEFCTLNDLLKRSRQKDGKISEKEWQWFYVLMSRVGRRLNNEPWSKIEARRGITEWFQVYRHRLSLWRASANDRKLWRKELERTAGYLIDPGVITREHITPRGTNNIAERLYEKRTSWLISSVSQYRSLPSWSTNGTQLVFADPLLGTQNGLRALHLIVSEAILGPDGVREAREMLDNDLPEMITIALRTTPEVINSIYQQLNRYGNVHDLHKTIIQDMYLSLGDFAKLADFLKRVQNGESVTTAERAEIFTILTVAYLAARVFRMPVTESEQQQRLRQLGLRREEFIILQQMRLTLAEQLPLLPEKWDAFCDVLAQSLKTRQYGRWFEEEHAFGITLSPDFFRIPAAASSAFQDAALLEWEQKLQERIDQELNLYQIIQDAVDRTEETALPYLRDALLLAAGKQSAQGLEAVAGELSDILLIDTRASSDQFTTRTALAIETMQGILWSVRNGLAADAHPGLQIGTEYFDEDWVWLGSYATWRSAMQIYIRPEYALLPQLRKWQTPGFRDFLKIVSGNLRLAPEDARQAAARYRDYFRDVCSLRQDAGIVMGNLTYLFGRSTVTQKVYWRTISDPVDFSQGCPFWEEIQALSPHSVTELIGTAVYKWTQIEFVYLFVVIQEQNKQLAFIRYNKAAEKWEDLQTLPLVGLTDFSAAVKDTLETEPPCIVVWREPDKKSFIGRLNDEGTIWEDPELLEDQISKPSWGPLTKVQNKYPNPVNYGGGIAVAHLKDDKQNDLLLYYCDTGEWDKPLLGHYQVGLNMSTGGIADWSKPALDVPNGLRYVDPPDGEETEPLTRWVTRSTAAVAALKDGPALVVMCLLKTGKVYTRTLFYRVGLKLGPDGVVKGGWSQDAKGNPQWLLVDEIGADNILDNSLAMTVAKIKNAADMVVFYLSRNPGRADYSGYYMIGWNMDKNGMVEKWSSKFKVPGSFSPFIKGVGITVANIDDSPNPDLIVFCVDHPDSGYDGYYRIGRNMNLDESYPSTVGACSEWTDYKSPIPVEGPFGLDNGGVGLAVANIDGNNNPDLLVFCIDNTSPASQSYYRIGWDIGNFTQQGLHAEIRIPGCVPKYGGPYDISEKRTQAEQDGQRQRTEAIYRENENNTANLIYLEEAWYFVPIQLALALQRSGEYTAALDWLRSVYDYRFPLAQRKIYYGLKREERQAEIERPADWLRDVLNPHLIAAARTNAYTRYTLLSIIRCLLDYADDEFTKDTGESVAKARTLYLSALELLAAPELADEEVSLNIGPVTPQSPNGHHIEHSALNKSILEKGLARFPREWQDLLHDKITGFPKDFLTSSAILAFVIPPNEIKEILRKRAELNLGKIRNGCNIAGMQRSLDPYVVAAENELVFPSVWETPPVMNKIVLHPTIYRYRVLIERARQLVQMAAQIEASMLNAMERQASAAYTLLNATQGLQLAQANITLQNLRLSVSEKNEELVALQMQLRQFQETHYENLLAEGYTYLEEKALYELNEEINSLESAKYLQVGVDFLGTVSSAFSGAMTSGYFGAALGITSGIFNGIVNNEKMEASLYGLKSQLSALKASYERQSLERLYQLGLVRKEKPIMEQQLLIAKDNSRVLAQEGLIARKQAENAETVVKFLTNQFLNPDLYEWMSNILESVYRYLLQQATSIARLAAQQLAFERHEIIPDFIQSDYWNYTSDNMGNTGASADRHGLTGSVRLLQDITQLDQYAFIQDKRKLQITKTISLAQLAPYEFSQFRQTGILVFATPLELFERDRPGDYLLLIKRVRVSMIALVPPSQGIKATLTSSGISRVVVPGSPYKIETIYRDPETVALSSPQNTTGLFELDMQSDLLWPFESNGVDMHWELRFLKAANPIDYTTVGDILITMEYTALHSPEYYKQVINQLGNQFQAERAFSLRSDYPDAWYELNNPRESNHPLRVNWQILRGDFPPNLENLSIQQIVLYFVGKNIPKEIFVEHLGFTDDYGRVGGSAVAYEGIISTRRSNGAGWMTMPGGSPVGMWELALPDEPEIRAMFDRNEIEDIVLVITYSGELPAWPMQ